MENLSFIFYFYQIIPATHINMAVLSLDRRKTKEKRAKILVVLKKDISLHPQTRNDGGIAQLVRAHDS